MVRDLIVGSFSHGPLVLRADIPGIPFLWIALYLVADTIEE